MRADGVQRTSGARGDATPLLANRGISDTLHISPPPLYVQQLALGTWRKHVIMKTFFHAMVLACGAGLASAQASTCSGLVELNSAQAFGDSYTHNADCQWRLTCPGGSTVELQFDSFDVENNWDYVYVFDASTVDASAQLGRYTGTSLPPTSVSTGNSMTVQLTSDGSVAREGFSASYSCVAAPPPPPPPSPPPPPPPPTLLPLPPPPPPTTTTEPTGSGFCGGFDLDNNGQAGQCLSNENSQNGEANAPASS